MKTTPVSDCSPLLRLNWIGALVLAGALCLSGCVTNTQIKDIVRDANYEMLLADAGPTPLTNLPAAATPGQSASETSVARLEAFVAQHPENPAMTTALRLRQATLYLGSGSYSLASAAFANVKPENLHTPRDQAIYALRDDLLWWYRYAQMADAAKFYLEQKGAAEAAMQHLAQQAATLDSAPDVRDFVWEMRAWIGLKLGLAAKPYGGAAMILADAIDRYGDTLSPDELRQVGLGTLADSADARAFDLSTRRILRAGTLLRRLGETTKHWAPADRPTLKHPDFQTCYATRLPAGS